MPVEDSIFEQNVTELNNPIPELDFIFLQDLSGSFSNDLANLQNSVDDVMWRLSLDYGDVEFALSTLTDGGVYRPVVAATTDTSLITSAYAGFTATGDEQEAILGALVRAVEGEGLALRPNSQRIVLVATDEPYNNNTAPDYIDIDEMRDALTANNAVPIFAVTSDMVSTYQNLVNELGRGVVVTISSDSYDFADNVRYALASLNGNVTDVGDAYANTINGADNFNDTIFGLVGDDSLFGLSGDDTLDGGSGADRLHGGAGSDELEGGTGDDTLEGGAGADRLLGGDGDDVLFGGDRPGVVDDRATTTNHSIATARTLDGLFSLVPNGDIENATINPHVTVRDTGDGDVHYYSFTVMDPNTPISIDIDHTLGTFDSYIRVYDAAGNVLAYDDDSSTYVGAGGSTSGRDAFLTTTIAAPGTYYLAVGSYPGLGAVPVGAVFDVSISIAGRAGLSTPVDDAGNDVLIGGAGADFLYGGRGSDTASYEDASEGLVADLSIASRNNGEALGDTYYSIENLFGSRFADTLVGNASANILAGRNGNDTLRGNNGNDRLFGESGNDVLDGGAGADTLNGGAGNDTYVLGAENDTVSDSGGTDRITSTIARSLAGHSTIENLTLLGAGNINGTGNALNNILTGNSGRNRLDGGNGNDTLNGGAGLDTLVGGTGNDTYVLGAENDTVSDTSGIDTITSTITRSLASFAAIENLQLLGAGNINGTGNALNNSLVGNNGRNRLDSGNGNDTLNGGAGLDTLVGGTGNDTYVLGAENDTVIDSGGNDLITSTISRSLAGYATIERLTLTGTSNINGYGNNLANTIIGNTGSNVLSGGAGLDTLNGGLGNDIYVLGSENDTVVDSGGNDLITSTITRSLAGYAAIERLTLMGSSSINGIGNGLSNTITGNSANNTLNGAAGNDTLLGGVGADRLYGGAGNDTVTGGTGADAFVFHATPNAATNVDRITDFSVVDDSIWLENGVFTALGATGTLSAAAFVRNTTGLAQDASDRLIYESDTGELYYDSNGSAAGGSVLIAVLNPNLLMTHLDFTVI